MKTGPDSVCSNSKTADKNHAYVHTHTHAALLRYLSQVLIHQNKSGSWHPLSNVCCSALWLQIGVCTAQMTSKATFPLAPQSCVAKTGMAAMKMEVLVKLEMLPQRCPVALWVYAGAITLLVDTAWAALGSTTCIESRVRLSNNERGEGKQSRLSCFVQC